MARSQHSSPQEPENEPAEEQARWIVGLAALLIKADLKSSFGEASDLEKLQAENRKLKQMLAVAGSRAPAPATPSRLSISSTPSRPTASPGPASTRGATSAPSTPASCVKAPLTGEEDGPAELRDAHARLHEKYDVSNKDCIGYPNMLQCRC